MNQNGRIMARYVRPAVLGMGYCAHFVFALLALRAVALAGPAQEPDWNQVAGDAARLLAEYIRIDTQNPPGRTVEAVEFLEKRAREAGLVTERTGGDPEKPILIARLPGRSGASKPIILLNHTDVVPAEGAHWKHQPLSGAIVDGVVHGRGALDMKGFGILQLVVLRLLAERGELPERDILFMAVPDEEVGGEWGLRWLVQNRPDLMDVEAVWNEGGMGVSDALPVPLLPIAITEKKVLWLRLIAEGPAGHGSRPLADASTNRLLRALGRILEDPPPSRLTRTTRRATRRIGKAMTGMQGFALRHIDNPLVWPLARPVLERNPTYAASIRDTISITMLKAGYKPNVIPERAEAVIDCRLLPGTKVSTFIEDMQRRIDDPSIRIEVIEPADDARPSSTRHPLYRAIESAALQIYPDAVVTPFMSIGATDSRFFRARGVPAYGLIPFVIPEELIATIHGVDERVPVAALAPAARLVYLALKEL